MSCFWNSLSHLQISRIGHSFFFFKLNNKMCCRQIVNIEYIAIKSVLRKETFGSCSPCLAWLLLLYVFLAFLVPLSSLETLYQIPVSKIWWWLLNLCQYVISPRNICVCIISVYLMKSSVPLKMTKLRQARCFCVLPKCTLPSWPSFPHEPPENSFWHIVGTW